MACRMKTPPRRLCTIIYEGQTRHSLRREASRFHSAANLHFSTRSPFQLADELPSLPISWK